jgi:CheY-like chemotaxis protein
MVRQGFGALLASQPDISVIGDAPDGAVAVSEVKRLRPDVVLMDVRMPEMDGLTATRAIRAPGGRFEELPIIALTANAFPEDVKICREAGMSDFLAKPLRKPALVAALLRALNLVASDEAPLQPGAPATTDAAQLGIGA